MGQDAGSTTTTKGRWADAITARGQALAGELGATGDKLTDINSVTVGRLQSLSGIGVHYAKRIVEGRPYQHTDELVKKKILPQHVYDKVKDRIVARQP
ncbi:MAG: helix-hairpin-helix domain-containing protein [Nitrospirae bacterium]|nr:helix-hairpin-helix domain-containing protein [Nitrospirota bacterium]